MKFMKGVFWGAMLSAGAWMIYQESKCGKGKMMKQGKRFMRNLGMM